MAVTTISTFKANCDQRGCAESIVMRKRVNESTAEFIDRLMEKGWEIGESGCYCRFHARLRRAKQGKSMLLKNSSVLSEDTIAILAANGVFCMDDLKEEILQSGQD